MAFDPIGMIDPITGGFTGGDVAPIQGGRVVRTKAANLFLSSPDNGITLDITLTILTPDDPNLPAMFNVYYLPPDSVTEFQVLNQFDQIKKFRQNVGQMPSAPGVSLLNVPIAPLYVTGGWMYAVAATPQGTEIYQYTTFPVEVPVFNADKTFPNTNFTVASAIKNSTSTPGIFQINLLWHNPFPLYGSVRYMKLWMFNYFNDGTYRELGHFRCNTQVGQVQPGIVFFFATDSSAPAHNVTFYFGEANASRMTTFLPVIGAYTAATLVGGI